MCIRDRSKPPGAAAPEGLLFVWFGSGLCLVQMTQAGDVAHRNGEDHSLGGRLDAGLGHDGLHDVLLVLGAGQDKDQLPLRGDRDAEKLFGQFHTCLLYTSRRAYIFYGKLDQVAAQLGTEFVRIHQRYLVRAGAVDRVTGSEVWVGEEILPISRSCQREALLALTRAALE